MRVTLLSLSFALLACVLLMQHSLSPITLVIGPEILTCRPRRLNFPERLAIPTVGMPAVRSFTITRAIFTAT